MLVRPHRRGGLVAVGVAALLLSATACAPAEAGPTPTPTDASASAPRFASEEEALAAAEEAYAGYLAMSDLIAQEGGREPERIAPYVTDEQQQIEFESFSLLEAKGITQIGASALRSLAVQTVDANGGGSPSVSAYACVDFSGVDLQRPDGSQVETVRQFNTVLTLVHFVLVDEDLRVAGVEPWEQSEPC